MAPSRALAPAPGWSRGGHGRPGPRTRRCRRRRSSSATCGRRAAPTLSLRTPRPISSGSTAGSAAASPQTETSTPAAPAACTTWAIRARTRGSAARAGRIAGSARSRPSTWLVRSLVPIEKKSLARRERVRRGGGGGELDHHAELGHAGCRPRRRRPPGPTAPGPSRPGWLTMGTMTPSRVSRPLRSTARS